jgi:hypothetical protein
MSGEGVEKDFETADRLMNTAISQGFNVNRVKELNFVLNKRIIGDEDPAQLFLE